MFEATKQIADETDKAIKRGWDNTKVEWQRAALNTIYIICLEKQFITANEFSESIYRLPLKTHDNRAIGGAVVCARKFGWIKNTGEVIRRESSNKNSHRGGHVAVWQSLIYRERPQIPGQQTIF